MARNRIAEAFVEVKTKGVESARAAFKKFGRDASRDAKGVGDNIEKGLGAAEKFQSVLGKLLIPIGVATSIGAIVKSIREAGREARAWREELEGIVDAVNDAAIATRQQVTGISEIDRARREALDRFNDAQAQILKNIENVDSQSLLDQIVSNFKALGTDEPVTATERVAAAMEQIDRLTIARQSEVAALLGLEKQLRDEQERQAEAIQRQNEVLNAQSVGGARVRELVSLSQQIADAEEAAADAAERGSIEAARAYRERARILQKLSDQTRQDIEDEKRARLAAIEEERRAREQLARETAAANAAAIDQLAQRQADAIASVIDSNSQQFARLIDLAFVAIDRLEVIRRNTKQ